MARSSNPLEELSKLPFANPDAGAPGAPSAKGHPKLHIVIGEPLPALTEKIRSSIPPSKYLLHVHAPGAGVEALRASRPEGERTLFLEIEKDEILLGRLSGILRTLRPDHADISVQTSSNPIIADALAKVRMAVDLELPNLQVDRKSGLSRLRCSLLNLESIAKGKRLSAKLADPELPALVLGAGPSLTGQLDFIKANAKRFLIVACGHAAIKLKEHGFEPDFVVEADPRCRINWSRIKENLSSPLAALSCADPAVCERFDKVVWLNGDSEEFKDLCGALGIRLLQAAISRGVIVTALDFAFKLGCRKAALAGCDLALSGDGATHAGVRRAEGDELSLIDVDGQTPGSKVRTNLDFDQIRIALERYIELAKIQDKVFNCTPSGARIGGIAHLPLKSFMAAHCPGEAKGKLLISESEVETPALLKNASGHIGNYARCAMKVAERARKVAEILESPSMSPSQLQKARDAFNEALAEEAGRVKASKFIELTKKKAEDCVDETPGSNPHANDALGQLRLYARRSAIAASFCGELKGDIDHALAALAGEKPKPRDPAEFQSFLEINAEAVSKSNPELAMAMASRSFPPPEASGFSLHLRFEDIPHVSKTLPDGSRVQFNGLISGHIEAKRLVAGFAKSFDPKSQAAILAAPGNYAVFERFATLFPDCPCLILDPWPELLTELCLRSLFLHRLAEGSAVIAVHDSMKSWRELLANAVLQLKNSGKELKILSNPRTSSLPEVKAILELKELS